MSAADKIDKKQCAASLLEDKITIFGEKWHLANTTIEVAFEQLATKSLAAVMLQVIPSFFGKLLEGSSFIYKVEKFLVCLICCAVSHKPAFCSLINCQFHILLVADNDKTDLICELDRLCFTY